MPFYEGHTYWNNPKSKATQFKKGQPSPRKGKKSTKPAWNNGLKRTWKSSAEYKIGQNAGEKHPMWKGGVSKVDKIVRRMREYTTWREEVFKRDNFTCQMCGINNCYVTAHHIISFTSLLKDNNIKSVADARKCDVLWDINNGKTLCEPCHEKTDNYKGRAQGKKRG
jgi:hypothetical protein